MNKWMVGIINHYLKKSETSKKIKAWEITHRSRYYLHHLS